MLFNSYLFIFIFFPLCITGFYALKSRGAYKLALAWLIGCSLWFYGFYSTSYLLIMLASIAVNRVLSVFLWVLKGHEPKSGFENTIRRLTERLRPSEKTLLITGVTLNLVLLGYFKYLDFLIQNLIFITGHDFPLRHIVLPLGISFFTFQQIGYLADIYRGEAKYTGILEYMLFVTFFPQLVAGPIVTHDEMIPQFESVCEKRFDTEGFARGLTLFITGLAKKVLIADALGAGVDAGYSMIGVLGGLDSFLVMIWYTLQLYFDFSGYCDMAMGLAGMLGIRLPVNFDSPYKANNIVEFWKRWHMTLTRFFTKYVYIPLGGSRRGEVRTVINILIVYFLSGLWHGAGWNFVAWGMLHGIKYACVRVFQRLSGKKKVLPYPAGCSLTFLYVAFCWVFFRASSVSEALALIGHMFTGSWKTVNDALATAVTPDEIWYVVKALGFERIGYLFAHNVGMVITTLIAMVMVFAFPTGWRTICPEYAKDAETGMKKRLQFKPGVVTAIFMGLLLTWCVVSLSGVSAFLYFNF